MNATVFVIRIVVGGLLVVAGSLKIGHPVELAAAIAGFRLLAPLAIGPLALALPYLEVLLGGYLIVGLFARVAAIVACAQFVVYAAAVASAVLRHIPAGCGCFGPNDSAVADWPHVAFDLGLALASAFIAYGAPGALAIDRKLRSV
ncbi:MAG: MauE/DoxX family redox-associated membrane protein [Candidatus Tumulicola sp.]